LISVNSSNGNGPVPGVDGEAEVVGAAGDVQKEGVEQRLKTNSAFLPEIVLLRKKSLPFFYFRRK
jgi:hypothetical protein